MITNKFLLKRYNQKCLTSYTNFWLYIMSEEMIVSLVLMLVIDRTFSRRKRKSSIGKWGLLSDYHQFSPMKEGLKDKHYASNKEVKTAVMKWLKEQSKEFYKAGIHALIRKVDHCYWEKQWLLKSMDVIHRGPASFWSMIHVSVSVIIPVQKKKALLFDSPS